MDNNPTEPQKPISPQPEPASSTKSNSGSTLSPAVSGKSSTVSSQPPKTIMGSDLVSKLKTLFKSKSARIVSLVIIIVLIVVGGAYAAYQKIVVDNRPINVVKTAFLNSLQQQDITATGSFKTSSASGPLNSGFTVEYTPQAKAVDLQFNFANGSSTFPVDVRYVNTSLYFKLGDLSSVQRLISKYSATYGPILEALSSKLSNQWFAVPGSLLDDSQAAKCDTAVSWVFTSADINLLGSNFNKYNFVTVNSNEATTLNGASVEKYNLTINSAKLNQYSNSLSGLSIAKTLSACDKSGSSTASKYVPSSGTTPMTVWVNKSTKQIVQLTTKYTDPKTKSDSGQGTVDFNYSKISITPPSGAEPVTELFTSLESALGAGRSNITL